MESGVQIRNLSTGDVDVVVPAAGERERASTEGAVAGVGVRQAGAGFCRDSVAFFW